MSGFSIFSITALARRGLAARTTALMAGAAAVALLSGCASLNSVQSEVSTFGNWPAGRAAGSYAIDRLPSQQTPEASPEQLTIEQGAQEALQRAGFTPVADGSTPDVMVQIGARVTRQDRAPWDDPLWWPGPFGPRWAVSPWGGPGWYTPYGPFGGYGMYGYSRFHHPGSDYQREVAVLIRDRASGQPLYEAHARSDGVSSGGARVLSAMFAAALQAFPAVQPEPRSVQVALPAAAP